MCNGVQNAWLILRLIHSTSMFRKTRFILRWLTNWWSRSLPRRKLWQHTFYINTKIKKATFIFYTINSGWIYSYFDLKCYPQLHFTALNKVVEESVGGSKIFTKYAQHKPTAPRETRFTVRPLMVFLIR